MDTMPDVTVISLTRGRPQLLRRAVESVKQQTIAGSIHHMVVVDDCDETRRFLEACRTWPPNLSWIAVPRKEDGASGPARLAVLRNTAVSLAKSPWISFLDDDNEFEPNHVESLVTLAAENSCRAVHSWLRMYHADGRPFIEPRDPWTRDPEEARRKYIEMVRHGVRVPGSNVFQDRAETGQSADAILTVDTGEWLFARELLIEVPFPTAYTVEDWNEMRTEDDKLLQCLADRGEPTACTQQATLRYYLGGYSNSFVLT